MSEGKKGNFMKKMFFGIVALSISVMVGSTISWTVIQMLDGNEIMIDFVKFIDSSTKKVGFDMRLEFFWPAKISQVGSVLIAVPLTKKIYGWLVKKYYD